jgi:hypothetical protein
MDGREADNELKGDKTAKKRGWMRVRGWVDGRGERVLLAVLVIDV